MKKEKRFSAISFVWHICSWKQKFIFASLFVLSFLRALTEIFIPLLTAAVVMKLQGQNPSILGIPFAESLSVMQVIMLCFALLFFFYFLGTVVRATVRLFAYKMQIRMHEISLNIVLEPRKNSQLKVANGDASYIIKNACDTIPTFFDKLFISFLPPIITSVVALIYIANVNILALASVLLTIGFVSLLVTYRVSRDSKIVRSTEYIQGRIQNIMLNNIENLAFVTFSKSKPREQELLHVLNKDYYRKQQRKTTVYIVYWGLNYLLEFLCFVATMYICLQSIPASMAVSIMIILIPYLTKIFSSVENLGYLISELQQSSIKMQRLQILVVSGNEKIANKPIVYKDETLKMLPLDEPIQQIEIKNMGMHIGTFANKDQNAVFKRNQITCITGESGAGKTIFLHCMLGMKEYDAGKIIVNEKYTIPSFFFENHRFSIAMQEGILFDRSLLENVAYPNVKLSAKAKKLLKEFGLQKLLSKDNEKTRENITIKTSISGGERKRINFIRCVSREAEVYILDEPTNELDEKNVERVINILQELKQNAVVIVVSHDPRVIAIADKHLKLEQKAHKKNGK